jgi:hypothetical protein
VGPGAWTTVVVVHGKECLLKAHRLVLVCLLVVSLVAFAAFLGDGPIRPY